MSYHITFHPVSKEELQYFFFDVVADPKLAEFRAAALSSEPTKQADILLIYEQLAFWSQPEERAKNSFSETFAFAAAATAGFLHPYWYTRGTWLGLMGVNEVYFCRFLDGLHALAPQLFTDIADDGRGRITSPYSGGGYIDHSYLPALQEALNVRFRRAADTVLGDKALEAINCAIDYALHTGTGLLEAAGIVVPEISHCLSDSDNLRLGSLGNTSNFDNARRPPAE